MSAMSSASISLYTARKASLSVEEDMMWVVLEVVLLALAEVDMMSGREIASVLLYHKLFFMVIGFFVLLQLAGFWRVPRTCAYACLR